MQNNRFLIKIKEILLILNEREKSTISIQNLLIPQVKRKAKKVKSKKYKEMEINKYSKFCT